MKIKFLLIIIVRIVVISALFIFLFVKTFLHFTSCFVLHEKTDLIISELYENSENSFKKQVVQTDFDYRNWDLLKKTNDVAYANAYAQAKCDGIIFTLFIILLFVRKNSGIHTHKQS